jgi:signal transduction histidine kinase
MAEAAVFSNAHDVAAPSSTKETVETLQYLRLNKDQSRSPTEILSKNALYEGKLSKIGICRDITSRVEMEKKIRESERMAYIGQITASLSHEIRNPLSAVKMNLQILKKNPQIKGNDQRRMDISVREVNRLENILQELLDFAKPLQLNPDQHEINRILTDSIELLEMKFKEKAIVIVADLDPDLPKIMVDRQKLEQALINILLNAMESSPRESSIQIASSFDAANGDRMEVTIADEGHGVPTGHMNDIFKPFFTTKSRGTGLGLSNACRIIEAHGGRIIVDNRQPFGAFFKISIPAGGVHG